MQILLDQGIFDMRNAGQNAMLQAAVERMKKFWPDASFNITTVAPNILKLYFPDADPVSPDGSHAWFKNPSRFTKIRNSMPLVVMKFFIETREEIWRHWPTRESGSTSCNIRSFFQAGGKNLQTTSSTAFNEKNIIVSKPTYIDVVSGANLFVATGSQYLCDHARDSGLRVLDRLEAAILLGIPTAMVGQGIGPIDDQDLRARLKEILPQVDLIFVRERLDAPGLLSSLGVDKAKVFITGDDAIELAYNARTSAWGNGIGISMRWMPSTQVRSDEIQKIAPILWKAAKKYGVNLVGLPISLSIHERDDLCVQQLLSGYDKIWMSRKKFPTPLDIVKNTQLCRLVVTGTFHGALLALAQGIPAICLVKSGLYKNKFAGLADLFGPGCQVVEIEDDQMDDKLISVIDTVWLSAENLRLQLLEAAVRQIDWGYAAYKQLFELVESYASNLAKHGRN